jgi:hypothetical protein
MFASLGFRIAGAAGILGTLLLGLLLIAAKGEIRHLTKVNQGLEERLAVCVGNTAVLENAIARQNAAMAVRAAADARKLADSTARLAAVQAAQRRSSKLDAAPKGDTLDARVRDVDARLLETLQ